MRDGSISDDVIARGAFEILHLKVERALKTGLGLRFDQRVFLGKMCFMWINVNASTE